MRHLLVLAVCGFGLVAAAIPASAQTSGNHDEHWRCPHDLDADSRIAACTALIEAGKKTPANLAVTYNDRGAAYDRKHQYDRALQDFDQAIRLDPKDAHARQHNPSL
jgi:tetratricopeptide (TPR) repeat protein